MATTTDLGSQTPPASVFYGDSFGAPLNPMDDYFTFSIPDASVDSITSTISLGSYLGIDSLQARLYSGTPGSSSGMLQAWSTAIPISMSGYSGTVAVISPITLGAGNYVLEIRGDVSGTNGGSYAGVLDVSPVPEPGEWPLLLSGFGLIGFIATRRRRNTGFAVAA